MKNIENKIPENILKLFIKAAFGMPRAFITLTSSYLESRSSNQQKKFKQVIEDQSKYIINEYLSIAKKLQQYKDIINIGGNLFNSIIKEIVDTNKTLSNTKQVVIGFKKQSTEDLLQKRMIKFLVEAGLIYPLSEVSHGDNRVYIRYIPHMAFLLKDNAFSGKSRGFKPEEILKFLNRKDEKHPKRIGVIESLLDPEDIKSIKLNLPSCTECNTTRIKPTQKFCHNCGHQLVNESKFHHCMKLNIVEVPTLTDWRKRRISEYTELKTIGDLYSHPQPATELIKAPGIGEKKSNDIYKKVIFFVEEFLS